MREPVRGVELEPTTTTGPPPPPLLPQFDPSSDHDRMLNSVDGVSVALLQSTIITISSNSQDFMLVETVL